MRHFPRVTLCVALLGATLFHAPGVIAADVAPIPTIPGNVINTISSQLSRLTTGPYLTTDYRAQIANLLGVGLDIPSTGPGPGEIQLQNPKRYLGPENVLLKKIQVQETSEQVWNITIDNNAGAEIKALLGSASLTSKDLETIEVVSTVSVSFRDLAGEENDIGDAITAKLRPGAAALWFTGFTVYRFKHTRYIEKEKKAAIGVGAISAGGRIYNKVEQTQITYRIIPTGYRFTKPKESGGNHTFTGSKPKKEDLRVLGHRGLRIPRR